MSQPKDSIKDQIISFYNNELYQKLNAYYGKTTLFNILKIERNENRHSAFLAWLLDVKGSHGLGEEPFRRFMRLLSKQDGKYDHPFLLGNYRIDYMKVDTERTATAKGYKRRGRVDVDVEFAYAINKDDKPTQAHIILENKIYTEEHDEQTKLYHDWALEEDKGKKKWLIGVFLSPEYTEKCAGDIDDFKYVKITYGDVLKYVIEPLLAQEMSDETRMIISDYIVNLGQPLKSTKDDGTNNLVKEDTILALTRENKDRFSKLYDDYFQLLNGALYSVCFKEKAQYLKNVFGEERFNEIEAYATDCELLKGFFESNAVLIRMILNEGLNNYYENKSEIISKLLDIRGNHRQKYIFNGLSYENKGRLCHAIVKCYAEQHKSLAVTDLQSVFHTPVKNDDKIVALLKDAQKTKDSSGKEGGNYYLKKEDWIPVKDGNVVVWSYWPDRFFLPFKECVKAWGFVIEEIE